MLCNVYTVVVVSGVSQTDGPSPAQPSPGAATLLGLTESIDNILIHFGIHSYAIFTQIIFLLIIVDFLFAGFPHGFPESKLNFTSSSGGH